MSTYTRLTVAGSIRRAEVVVSSDEPLGAVLPRLLDLLGETGGTVARPLTLVASDGERLDVGRSPQQLDLGDGALLQLVRLDAAPPPPVVIDVTDAAADAHAARPDRWNDRARAIAGGVGIALAAGAAGFITPYGGAITAAWVLLIAFVALLSIATLLGLLRLPGVSACVSAAAAGVIVPLGVASLTASGAGGFGPASAAEDGGAVLVAAGSSVVLLGLGVGLRRPGAAAGGAVGAVLASILLVLLLVGVGAEASAAIVGTIAAFATGPLPWIALSAAGLTRLDQGVAAGERLERPRAFASIDDAYSALTWSVGTVSAVLAVSGIALVLASELERTARTRTGARRRPALSRVPAARPGVVAVGRRGRDRRDRRPHAAHELARLARHRRLGTHRRAHRHRRPRPARSARPRAAPRRRQPHRDARRRSPPSPPPRRAGRLR